MAFGDNADDTYTETETISYGSRISGSFKGMLPGILMFLGAFPLIFWNERSRRQDGAGVWFLWKKRAALKAKAGAALYKAKEIKKKVEEAEKKGTNI